MRDRHPGTLAALAADEWVLRAIFRWNARHFGEPMEFAEWDFWTYLADNIVRGTE